MILFQLLRAQLCLVFTISIATLLSSQTTSAAEYELQIADRLYAFEMARQSANHEALLGFVYPELFTLIPREILLDNMRGISKVAKRVNRLEDFRLQPYGEAVETNGKIFLRITYEFKLPESDDSPRFVRASNGAENRVVRQLLAIRTDHDLQWYFLEIQDGQEDLLSAIIPQKVLKAN